MKILILTLFLSSCAVVPTHKTFPIEYCERIDGVIYCKDQIYDTNCNPRYYNCNFRR